MFRLLRTCCGMYRLLKAVRVHAVGIPLMDRHPYHGVLRNQSLQTNITLDQFNLPTVGQSLALNAATRLRTTAQMQAMCSPNLQGGWNREPPRQLCTGVSQIQTELDHVMRVPVGVPRPRALFLALSWQHTTCIREHSKTRTACPKAPQNATDTTSY